MPQNTLTKYPEICESAALQEIAMKHLQDFLRSLRHTSVKQPGPSEDTQQRTRARVGVVVPLRAKMPGQRQRANERYAPNEADYERAERLRDLEYRYEFDLWRLW